MIAGHKTLGCPVLPLGTLAQRSVLRMTGLDHVCRRLTVGAARYCRRFHRDERGNLVIFGVYIWLLIFMVAGIGIDLMRLERDRTSLQYTLDRAVLAAADLDQTLDPKAVVKDYVDKAGLGEYVNPAVVKEGLGYRIVSATAKAEIDTHFMHMNGVDTLVAPASATAEESIGGVEVSLVLDVSGSMGRNSRLTNLKSAAKKFVDEMHKNSEEDKLSISIVPYAEQVAMPEYLFEGLDVEKEQEHSFCINFEAGHFNTTSVTLKPLQGSGTTETSGNTGQTTAKTYEQTMHFDVWDDYDGRSYNPKRLVTAPTCEDASSREIMLLEKDPVKLKAYIDAMWADGNTSIDLGMKWGAALVDPSMQPLIKKLTTANHVDDAFKLRPHDYNDGETLKVIVLMTDGQNTDQHYLRDDYRTGESNIWWNDQEERYSVYVGLDEYDDDNDGDYDEPLFYWPDTDEWKNWAYGEGTYNKTIKERYCKSYKRNGSCKRYKTRKTTVTVNEPGEAKVLSYEDLYAYTSLEWIVEDLYEPWMSDYQAWDDWYHGVHSHWGRTTKDARSRAICNAAKGQNVVVFAIGFEAPYYGDQLLRDCASSPAHFFDVNGLQIEEAFSSIASSIRKLRLTQ